MKNTVQPKFNMVLYSIPVLIPFLIFTTLIIIFPKDEDILDLYFYFFLLYGIIFFLLRMPYLIYKYKFITFLMAEDKLSYIRDFLGYYRNDIKYENIKEVVISQGMIQKLFGLGDVYLISNIAGGNAGITFFNLENPHQVYEIIQEKIAQHQNR
jgi:membrane protein YdbS with pleckstrin-like domain